MLAFTHSYLNSLLFSNNIEFFLLILFGLAIWIGLKICERRNKDEDVSNSFL